MENRPDTTVPRAIPSDAWRDLAYDLRARIRGEVRFDTGSRALYATDSSNYRQVPIGVVIPEDADDVVGTMEVCRVHQAPVLSRGGGTSLAGQCCNVAVVMDFSKRMDRILEVDPLGQRARVQPGTVLDSLRNAAYPHHLTFAPDPSTHTHCTLGGMIGNNSCGVHSVLGGRTADNVHELDILCYDGTRLRVGPTTNSEIAGIIAAGGRRGDIYRGLRDLRDRYADLIRSRFPRIPRRVSGYGLDELLPENGFHVARSLVGSEGTCVAILEADVRLVPWPKARVMVILGYADVYHAGDHITEVMAHHPIGLEGMDDRLVQYMTALHMHAESLPLLPEGHGWLLVEFGGETPAEAREHAEELIRALEHAAERPSIRLITEPQQQEQMWLVRESGLGATAHIPGEPVTWEGWEDAAVPPDRVGAYLRGFRALLDRYRYGCALYGHFGQGCIHTRIDFDMATVKGIAQYRAFTHEAAELCLSMGGSLSGEHGDGQSRGELLPMMFGAELMEGFRQFKTIWDPDSRMNPGKKIDAAPRDEHLRLGPQYQPWVPETHFHFASDGGNFARTALRCVGVGNCRQHDHGTMCPSYMVTREEKHSTRGRAHLLFEMLRGEVIRDGWRSREVKDALDLCLSCKGCRGECPVRVDMATYKAEFLSHFYQGRLRPRSAYAMGLIHWWATLAGPVPWLANAITQTPVLRSIAAWIGGIAPERRIPRFADRTFVSAFRARSGASRSGRRVLLWVDTFTNHFHPQIAHAAVEVLEAAGFNVAIPAKRLCCGRPLYDYGMLTTAKRMLQDILIALRDDIRAGTPMIGLEPSCLAVFRDELCGMFPFNEDARRLSGQVFTLGAFLAKEAPGFGPRLERTAVVQSHCHHKAVMGLDGDQKTLARTLASYELLDAGCCGMAGSFGFEKQHYTLSTQCGERSLLPRIRASPPDQLIIADGFSCREQIGQLTGRHPHHLAEVLAMALHAPSVPGEALPSDLEPVDPIFLSS